MVQFSAANRFSLQIPLALQGATISLDFSDPDSPSASKHAESTAATRGHQSMPFYAA